MSLIFSYLNYCNLIWDSADIGIIQPIFILQKRVIRHINKSHYLDHTSPIFKSLNFLNIFQMFQLNCLLFAYKCINLHMFPYLREKITQGFNVHSYNTRLNNNYRINERAQLRIITRSFLHKGINLWNSLDSWKTDCSLSSFKIKVKSYLIANL